MAVNLQQVPLPNKSSSREFRQRRSERGTSIGLRYSFLSPSKFSSVAHKALALYCFCAPLSIGAAQACVLPLLVYWILFTVTHRSNTHLTGFDAFSPATDNRYARSFLAAVVAWALIGILSSLTGLNLTHSLPEVLKNSSYLLLPFCILTSMQCVELSPQAIAGRIKVYFVALVAGQCVAASHTLETAILGYEPFPRPPGAVTESGQLVLVLPCLIALLLVQLATYRNKALHRINFFGTALSHVALAAIVLIGLLLVAWPNTIFPAASAPLFRIGCFAVVVALTILPWIAESFRKTTNGGQLSQRSNHLLWSAGALLVMALVVNLKRGPWAGVVVSMSILGLFVSRKIAVATYTLVILVLTCFPPVQTRLFNLVDDFTIGGGRQTLWELGSELVQRFPLGVGGSNARYLRELDPSLPFTHPHMHNNILNVAVENGWLGVAIYCWWMYVAIALGFVTWRRFRDSPRLLPVHIRIIALCIACALLGWQVAGVVEYNFGDGEVRLIALLLMGLGLTLECATHTGGNTVRADL